MIYTDDLTKKFDQFTAVDGVSLNVQPGQVLALLGPNGAGKTTTVRMLTSILVPTRGRAEVAGYDVVKHPEKVRASVGVLTEHHGLYNRMNADEYLEFYGGLYGMEHNTMIRRATDMLERFGLIDARRKRLGEYSKGMRQKLALLRAMLHDPPVLLLDEPTSAMDPESSRMVRDLIHSLRSTDRTIILCTHNLPEAEELADQVAIIRHGHIILNDPVDVMKHRLLGPKEYEAHFNQPVVGELPAFPLDVDVTARGENWIRFRVGSPGTTNPVILKVLLNEGLAVVSFQEVSRSLEKAYLAAVLQEGNHGS
jgi:ABC-2 type transport system ATP-binding protein